MKDRKGNRTGPPLLWQGMAICLFAAALGLLVNQVRPGGLPLLGDRATEPQADQGSQEERTVSLDDARDLFLSGKALFLDARSPGLFREGHIPGARNLPWESFDQTVFEITADIPQDGVIITYCDGRNCPLSAKLTAALLGMGFRNVRTLGSGWSGWGKEDLPIETGPGSS